MNFEFLKGLRGLESLYNNCSNAEKLAMTMPEQSMITSRKSAELLARFLYMTSHQEKMENLSFAEILSDPVVKRFINNREVIDAFHYIRKSGNHAAHSGNAECSESAIDVLQDLHYVTGEAALLLGLIKDYPAFSDDISAFPNAFFVDEKDIEKKAFDMFISYVEKYDAQLEREKYVELSADEMFRYSIEGNVDMHEYLEIRHKPRSTAMVEYLQSYLSTLLRLSIERAPEQAEKLGLIYPVVLDARIVVGDKLYSSHDPHSFLQAIYEELPNTESLMIDCICSGCLREYYNDDPEFASIGSINMIRKDAAWTGLGMWDHLESFKRRESFVYHYMSFLPDSGSIVAASINQGRSIHPSELYSAEINASPDLIVNCDCLGIFVESEKNISEYPEFVEAFKKLVRENVYDNQQHFCEEAWDPKSADYVSDCIISYVQIKADTIGEYGAFLNKLNQLAEPWKDQLKLFVDEIDLADSMCSMIGSAANILYNIKEMTLGQIVSVNGNLQIIGTVFKRDSKVLNAMCQL